MVQGAGQVGGMIWRPPGVLRRRIRHGVVDANLAALYQQSSPPRSATDRPRNNPPDSTMISSSNYQESITWTPDAFGNPASHTSVIDPPSPNAVLPRNHSAYAEGSRYRPGGASVNMTRGVEVALIRSSSRSFLDSDLSYFAGPNFNFQGPGAHQRKPVPGRRQREFACS